MGIIVLASFCLTATLFATLSTSSSPRLQQYDQWLDINDDGNINILDISAVAKAFGSTGVLTGKATILCDTGWLSITDKAGQYVTIALNLSNGLEMPDWNNESIIVEITGKTVPDGELLRYLGLWQLQGWNRTFGGTSDDYAFVLLQTTDGGYALAGETDSYGAGLSDVWLVKTDANGNHLWNKTYGGTGEDYAEDLVQTADGGYALAGVTDSFGAGNFDFWLVKTDANGNHLWNKTYGGTDWDAVTDFVQTTDGGYALAGRTLSFGAGNFDVWLVKTDADGNHVWNKTYGGTNYDGAFALVQTPDGGYALAGGTNSYGAGLGDVWLVKTDANGNHLWNRTYGGIDSDYSDALVQTTDGGYALAGWTRSFGAGDYDVWLVKTDASGSMLWNKTYGGIDGDYTDDLVQTMDHGYALACWTLSFGAGSNDAWLVKTNADGGSLNREHGLIWVDSSADLVTLYRGKEDVRWNYVRVRILKAKE